MSIISLRLVLERQIFSVLIMVLQSKEECTEMHDCFSICHSQIYGHLNYSILN